MYNIPKTPKTIKVLIYINVLSYIFYIAFIAAGIDIATIFGIVPYLVLKKYYAWQFITYMFMHGSIFHLMFNMLMLWMLGTELFVIWGNRFFLKYYFLCGIGAGIAIVSLSALNLSSLTTATIGSSGAIFGLLLAYGTIFKNKLLYVFGLFPIKAFKLILIMGAIELISLFSGENSSISHLAHLGGLVTGFLYLKIKTWQRITMANKYKKPVHDGSDDNNVITVDFKNGNTTWN